ncbi:kelch-like protein 38 [Babylonia areolata]|uniref:kelch-like protein 38 n=1 Tax=Babylonia areolata TaxID=304850 RepID=UPI003FD51E10
MNSQQQRVLQGLQDLYDSCLLTDVTLVAGNTRVPCHRNVLAASSPYFRAMFTTDVSESCQSDVTLQDVTGETLRELVTYLYRGHVTVRHETVEELMTAASMLQVDCLVDFLEMHMVQALTLDNCVEVLAYADFHNLSTLKEAVRQFVMDHFTELLAMGTLQLLPFTVFRDLVQDDRLNVSEEEVVYEAVMLWVRHDIEDRHRHFTKLFQLVRLPLLSREYVESDVLMNPLVNRDPYCRGLVTISNLYRIRQGMSQAGEDPEDEGDDDMQVNTKRRNGMFNKVLLVFSGGAGSESERSFTAFDPDSQTSYLSIRHHPTFDYKYKIDHFRLVVTQEGGIFFVGGIFFDHYHFDDHGQAMNTVMRYDQRHGLWQTCAPMNSARCSHAICTRDNQVMVFGGYNTYPGYPPLDSCELYHPEVNAWTTLDSMPVGIAHHAATVHRDCVYLFGGIDDEGCYLNTVICYHVNRDTWSLLDTRMSAARAECSAFTFNDKMYVLGGCNQTANLVSVEVYDPDTNRWQRGEDFPDERKFSSVAQVGSDLYVCGGVRQTLRRASSSGLGRRMPMIESRDLHRYDLLSNTWSRVTRNVPFGCHVTCVAAMLNVKQLQEVTASGVVISGSGSSGRSGSGSGGGSTGSGSGGGGGV